MATAHSIVAPPPHGNIPIPLPPNPTIMESSPLAKRPLSFASIVKQPRLHPRFPPLVITSKNLGVKEGKPAVSFSASEYNAGAKRFAFSLIAKFTVGRPSIQDIQSAFQQAWRIEGRATISDIWDGRHLLIILDSEKDVANALSCPMRKVGHSLFRLFRWSHDYNPRKESSVTTAWVRLPDLPLPLYDAAFIAIIVSTFGTFLDVDDKTKACSSMKFARVCMELDVSKPIPEAIWINLPNEQGYWQQITIESNLKYCSKCKLHGHDILLCRKMIKQAERKSIKPLVQGMVPDSEKDPGSSQFLPSVSLRVPQTSIPAPAPPSVKPAVPFTPKYNLSSESAQKIQVEQKGNMAYDKKIRLSKAAKRRARKAKNSQVSNEQSKDLKDKQTEKGSHFRKYIDQMEPITNEISNEDSNDEEVGDYNALGLSWKHTNPNLLSCTLPNSQTAAKSKSIVQGPRIKTQDSGSNVCILSLDKKQVNEEDFSGESDGIDDYTSWTLVEARRNSKDAKRKVKRLAIYNKIKSNDNLDNSYNDQREKFQDLPKRSNIRAKAMKENHKGVKQHPTNMIDV